GQPGEPVRALQELVTEPRPPGARQPGDVRDAPQAVSSGVGAANQDGERVVEPEGREPAQSEARGILALDYAGDAIAIAHRGVLQDRGEGRARILGVQVDLPGEDRLVTDERAPQVEPPLDGVVQAALQL